MARRTDTEARETFLVEHYRPDLEDRQLEEFAARTRRAVRALEREGTPLRFVRSLIVPSDRSCLCVVEATSEHLVREAYTRAGIPFERISLSRVLPDSETE